MGDAEHHRDLAAACRTKMKGETSDARLRDLERIAAEHDRAAEFAAREDGDSRGELLIDGQEEVFSRTELDLGRIEHDVDTDGPLGAPKVSL
ncbi:MAG: hypothetical protein KA105_00195 [Caulobacter sp.]|nr:hypothetical protein [Caulobacter sp.]